MGEVNVRIVHFALDLARAGNVDEAALLEGLPSITMHGAFARWIHWSDFADLWERLEEALGGPDGFARVARHAIPTAYPEVRAFAALFVSPMALFRFLALRHMPTSFKNVEVEELERFDDGRIRWRETIAAPHRACAALHRTTRTFASLIPLHLDLPVAEAEITSLTPRTAEFIATFPPPPPLKVRGRHAVSAATSLVAAQLDEAFAGVVERMRREPARKSDEGKIAAWWANELDLSPRQREVYALLVEGRTNKDIAAQLQCSMRNVEFHIGRIFRAAGVTTRSALLVKVLAARSDA